MFADLFLITDTANYNVALEPAGGLVLRELPQVVPVARRPL